MTAAAPIANVEAEVALIASMLCSPSCIDVAADRVRAEDFSDQFIGHVFSLILSEHGQGRACNPVTIRPRLEGQPAFHDLGGMAWLADLTAESSSILGVRSFAEDIADAAKRRRLVDGLVSVTTNAYDLDCPVDELCAAADQAITDARQSDEGGEHSAADCFDRILSSLDKPLSGVTCDIIPSLDNVLGPIRPGHLVYGGGRPGMGKTAAAASYALGAAQKGYGVLFVSLEMGADELAERMAADMCFADRVSYSAIRDKELAPGQRQAVRNARDKIAKMPLHIVDKAGLTFSQLRALARRWKRRFEARGQSLDLIIVDYLQLLRSDTKMEPYQRVSEASITLKEVAKQNGCGVFALAQLSRSVEQRADKRPQLADLRDSGQIEQDADAVVFFYRDEYYLRLSKPSSYDEQQKWDQALRACLGKIEFICAKRRNGETGSSMGDFFYHYQAVRG